MFVGREKEVQMIQNRIDNDGFEFGIIYGRRRIGKTTLLKEILKRNKGIYFVASEMDYAYNLDQFAKVIANYFNEPVTFSSMEMLFKYVIQKSINERLIIIIDEFTYLFVKEPGVQSLLQNIIDNELSQSNIVLILSGSQVGMIEETISYHKPLYGRATFKQHLKGFDYFDSAKFYEKYSDEDKIRTYAVFGGIPYYLSKINDNVSLKENIINLILNDDSILKDEIEFFLKQKLRSVISYSMIIHSISSGATKLNEISTKSQVNNTGTTTKYVTTLTNLDIIEKEMCFGEKSNSKKTLYKIKDNFFNFYYKFIHSNKSKLTLVNAAVFYDRIIKNQLDEYVSFIFEKICHQFLMRKSLKKEGNGIYEIAKYWGNHKELKREVEIDIATKDDKGITVYECKWTNDQFRKAEFNDLYNDSSLLNPYRYGGFSKNGFSEDAKKSLTAAYTIKDLFKEMS